MLLRLPAPRKRPGRCPCRPKVFPPESAETRVVCAREDSVGTGAILSHLSGPRSPEAAPAVLTCESDVSYIVPILQDGTYVSAA
jgi:hypothetical protein